ELSGIGAVACQPGAVREHLRDRGRGDLLVQSPDILSDGIVEPHFALLAQFQDAGRGERLGVRGDAETVTRRQLLAGCEIGEAEGMFGDDLAAMSYRDDAARLLGGVELECDE